MRTPAGARVVARRAARRFRGQAQPRAARCGPRPSALVAEIAAGRPAPLAARPGRRRWSPSCDGSGLAARRRHRRSCRRPGWPSIAGDLDDARERSTASASPRLARSTTRLLWREVRAELAEARGDGRHARDHVRAGLADLHAWQSSFGSLDLQSTLVGHGRDLALQGLAARPRRTGRPALVFEWSERARALVGRVTPVRPPADEQVAADLTELRVLQAGRARRRATPRRRRVEELRQRVRQRRWYGAGAGVVAEPGRASRSCRRRSSRTTPPLVAHLVVKGRVAALVVTPDGRVRARPRSGGRPARPPRRSDLGPDHGRGAPRRPARCAACARRCACGSTGSPTSWSTPLLPHARRPARWCSRPSGSLAGTPWSLLPGPPRSPAHHPHAAPPAGSTCGSAQLLGTGRVGLVAGPGVARGPEEVARGAAAWKEARVLCGDDATAARVAELAAEVDVLHLAGHGRHTGENPLFSAVELADGPWFGYDIDQLPRAPSTVVLSACELGRVTVRSGEEAIGMSAAWLHAGARTVLSSPVLIADDVACEAMGRWHTLVARGTAPADALAEVCAGADDVVPMLSFGVGW